MLAAVSDSTQVSTAIYGAMKTLTMSDLRRVAMEVSKMFLIFDTTLRRGAWLGGPRWSTRSLQRTIWMAPRPLSSHFQLSFQAPRWIRRLAQMSLVGGMRFTTVVLGLVSLALGAKKRLEALRPEICGCVLHRDREGP